MGYSLWELTKKTFEINLLSGRITSQNIYYHTRWLQQLVVVKSFKSEKKSRDNEKLWEVPDTEATDREADTNTQNDHKQYGSPFWQ